MLEHGVAALSRSMYTLLKVRGTTRVAVIICDDCGGGQCHLYAAAVVHKGEMCVQGLANIIL